VGTSQFFAVEGCYVEFHYKRRRTIQPVCIDMIYIIH